MPSPHLTVSPIEFTLRFVLPIHSLLKPLLSSFSPSHYTESVLVKVTTTFLLLNAMNPLQSVSHLSVVTDLIEHYLQTFFLLIPPDFSSAFLWLLPQSLCQGNNAL